MDSLPVLPIKQTVLLVKESDATKNKESVSTKNTKESDPIKNAKESDSTKNAKESDSTKNAKESDSTKNTKEPDVTKNTEESDASKNTEEPDSSKNVKESDSSKTTKEPDAFKMERDERDTFVRVFNSTLIEALRKYLPRECLYEQHPKVPVNELFLVLSELRKAIGREEQKKDKETKKPQKPTGAICNDDSDYDDYDDDEDYDDDDDQNSGSSNNNKHLELLVDLIENEYESRVYRIKKMIENNVISFKNLFYLFPKGQHIRAIWNERVVGAKVTKIMYRKGCFGSEFMLINAEVIDSDGITYVHGNKSFYISDWEGVCNIDELPVVPLPEESPIRDELIARGRKFVKYSIGPNYLQYSGNIFRNSWFGTILFRGDGRVMIDTVSFAKINPSYEMGTAKKSSQSSYYYDSSTRTTIGRIVKEEELFMCAPTLYGFSFAAKKWGQIYIDQLEDIKFDDDAFDQLVMDPTKKDLISSLVTSKHQGMDLISGKGGGCIFLLHGPPGVGKTLTAEAISEYLHRPLYAVSVGELGTTIVELEKKLSEILEVANVWNAVILIDEADIFLERRSEHDIKRNGLVSIFLRLLEYHQGILFLTTNRVKCFDAAFQSRISVALKYNDLDADARGQIWRTFLDRAEGKGRSNVDIESLKKRPLNGREIKTAVRLAKALATKNNPDALITTKQLETILDISKSFSDEISGL